MLRTCLLGLALLTIIAPVVDAAEPPSPEKVVMKVMAIVDHCVEVDESRVPPVYVREDCPGL